VVGEWPSGVGEGWPQCSSLALEESGMGLLDFFSWAVGMEAVL
jgi:hypothetical protein